MGFVRVISASTLQAPSQDDGHSTPKFHLTPWDLHVLPVGAIQKGLLCREQGNCWTVGLEEGVGEMIGSYSDEKVRRHYESWVKTPTMFTVGSVLRSNFLANSSFPRFDVYGNNFGWGKPVAVRSGCANKRSGKISLFAGAEEGSIDIEVCLPYEILEALGNDHEFMDAVSI